MGKENNRADGELVVNHVIRRKEALIRLFDLPPIFIVLDSWVVKRKIVVDRGCAIHFCAFTCIKKFNPQPCVRISVGRYSQVIPR